MSRMVSLRALTAQIARRTSLRQAQEVNNENNPHAQGSKDGIEQIDEPHDTSMPASDVWPNNLLSEIETESLSERDRLETIVVLDTVCFFTFSKALGGCHAASRRRGGNTLRPQRRSYVATARFRNTHIRACVRLLKDSLEELKDIANDPTMPHETFSRKKNRELVSHQSRVVSVSKMLISSRRRLSTY